MGKLCIVVGGQFGSEGKGAIAGYLSAEKNANGGLLAVRVAGPNAGHSVVDSNGHKWPLRTLPVAAVSAPGSALALSAGSEVDMAVLEDEVTSLDKAGFNVSDRLVVDPQCSVIDPAWLEQEKDLVTRVGSTGKGIGITRAKRIMREAPIFGDEDRGYRLSDVSSLALDALNRGSWVLVEGAQGFGLGLHAGHYPQCTSSDCRAIDTLSMAGISPWHPSVSVVEPWVVLRTYPIRVAGNSGPLQNETNWDELSEKSGGYIKTELTTVTHKPRRIGSWDIDLARRSVAANGGAAVKVALTFFDYWFPELAGATASSDLKDQHLDKISSIESQLGGARIALVGTGPDTLIEL